MAQQGTSKLSMRSIGAVMSAVEFGAIFQRLLDAFPRYHISQGTIEVYFDRLRSCQPEELRQAIDMALDESEWFPSIAEIRRHYSVVKERNAPKPLGYREQYNPDGE